MKCLLDALDRRGFFEAQASKYHHNNYKGGLCNHSLNVYYLFKNMCKNPNIRDSYMITKTNIIVAALLHDVVKILVHPKFHGLSSLNFLSKYIKLYPLEKELISYHMGHYGAYYNDYNCDLKLSFKEQIEIYNKKANENPLIKVFHWCDDYSAQFLEETNEI